MIMSNINPPTLYFPVSLVKLAVMSFCTLGLYQLYWFSRNWDIIKDRDHSAIKPSWRAILSFFYCYPLLKNIQATAATQEIWRTLSPLPLTAAWIATSILSMFPDYYGISTALLIALILHIQRAINDINIAHNPRHNPNVNFSRKNIAIIIIGGITNTLIITSIFFSA